MSVNKPHWGLEFPSNLAVLHLQKVLEDSTPQCLYLIPLCSWTAGWADWKENYKAQVVSIAEYILSTIHAEILRRQQKWLRIEL